jgi:hypothetical protein
VGVVEGPLCGSLERMSGATNAPDAPWASEGATNTPDAPWASEGATNTPDAHAEK